MKLSRVSQTTMLLVVILVATFPLVAGRVSTQATDSSTPSIDVKILFANYSDLDSDTYEDDVYAEVSIHLSGSETYTFDYYVVLTLPSGKSFSYLFIITTNVESFTIHNFFYDHAIESGWYKLDVVTTLNNGGRSTSSSTMIFDPPGGSSGSDPDLEITL